jgi:hypothetical protein
VTLKYLESVPKCFEVLCCVQCDVINFFENVTAPSFQRLLLVEQTGGRVKRVNSDHFEAIVKECGYEDPVSQQSIVRL